MSEAEILSLRSRLNDRDERIAYCRSRVGKPPRLKRDRPIFSRAAMVGGKVLGVGFDPAKVLLGRGDPKLSFEAARSLMPDLCPIGAVGYVYHVECPEYPGVRKIGFTTNLARRLQQLRTEYRVPLAYVETDVGTYVDEYACQRAHGRYWLTGEWFGRPDEPRFAPPFLLGTLGALSKELAERWLGLLGRPGAVVPNNGPFHSYSEATGMDPRRPW